MDERIKQKCDEAGIDPRVLTDSEREELMKEIEAEESGKIILDGVLSRREIILR